MAEKQDQNSGDQSLNVQAGRDIIMGHTLAEMREVAQLTFDANILKMYGIAHDVMRERGAELREDLLARLLAENPSAVTRAANPDFQYALFDAQKAYARTGDQELGKILVDMLVDRVARDERSLISVVLGESLTVAPKLTAEQFDVLTVSFLLRYSSWNDVVDVASLQSALRLRLVPFLRPWPVSYASYEHLQYAGCGDNSVLELDLPKLFRDGYPQALSSVPDDAAVETILRAGDERLTVFVNTWKVSGAKRFMLTTVGKAIAHANFRRKTGDTSDLAVWVN